MYGVLQIIEKQIEPVPNRNSRGFIKAVRTFFVFAVTVAFAVLFRADSIKDAAYLFTHCFSGVNQFHNYISCGILNIGLTTKSLILKSMLYFVPLAIFDYVSLKHDLIAEMSNLKSWIRHLIYITIILVITLFHAYSSAGFVYFQF
jgi:hypothetical protein